MDPSVIPTLAAVLSAIAGGAAGEVGKSAWSSLTGLVRRRFGDDAVAAIEGATPEETTGSLVERAQADPEFGEALTSWTAETARLVQVKHDVSNTISGDAKITGPVVQAGDIFGSITFGKS
jgi:hypothetical protein